VLSRSAINGNNPEADCFAANLLIPEEFLIRKMRKHSLGTNDIDILADLFAVSFQFMKSRMEDIVKR
jgi:Zn-dependent peptidase ImmA (M78 family)